MSPFLVGRLRGWSGVHAITSWPPEESIILAWTAMRSPSRIPRVERSSSRYCYIYILPIGSSPEGAFTLCHASGITFGSTCQTEESLNAFQAHKGDFWSFLKMQSSSTHRLATYRSSRPGGKAGCLDRPHCFKEVARRSSLRLVFGWSG
jgi:hypothetical protein